MYIYTHYIRTHTFCLHFAFLAYIEYTYLQVLIEDDQMWYSWQGASSELFMDCDPYPYCTTITAALIKLSTWLLPHCYCFCPVCQPPEVLRYLSGTDISGNKKHPVPMGIAINQNWTGYQVVLAAMYCNWQIQSQNWCLCFASKKMGGGLFLFLRFFYC